MPAHVKKLVISLGIAQCISWGILFYAFAVLLLPMTQDLPLGQTQISFMATLAALVAAFASLPVGRRLDQGRHLRLMMSGSIIGALSCLLWSWAHSAIALYLAAIFMGLAQASTLYEPVFAFLLKYFPEDKQRHKAMMQVTLIGGLASTIFLPLTSLLVEALGWRGAVQVLAFFLLFPSLIYWYWQKKTAILPSEVNDVSPSMPSRSLQALPLDARLILITLLLIFLVNGIVHTTLTTHLPSALQSWGLSAFAASWAVGMMGAMQLVGRLFLPLYLEACQHRSLLFAPLSALALILAIISFLTDHPLSWFLLALVGISSGLLTLLRPTVVSTLFDVQIFGRVNGLLAMVYQLARAGGPVGGSWVVTSQGGYSSLFIILAGLLVFAALLSVTLRKSQGAKALA
ncbi:MAG: MFS transporter [Oligoflexus sp.]